MRRAVTRRRSWGVVVTGALVAAAFPVVTLSMPAAANPTLSTQQRFVPDVVAQFDALALRPEGLAFDPGTSPDASKCRHYQGMARKQGPDGTPYLFVSRSGVVPFGCFGDDEPGNLLVVRMESRDKTGERLRSNRLRRDINGSTQPDPRDVVVTTITFDGGADWPEYGGTSGWPSYGHPGGMQLVGDVLAVAMEGPYEGAPDAAILFLDVSDPETPRFLSAFPLEDAPTDWFGAGTIGITPRKLSNGACCRYLMVVTGKENREVRFYESHHTGDAVTTDLASPDLSWDESWRLSEAAIENSDCFGGVDWPSGTGFGHQTLNFVRQGSLDGPLYMVGARNDFPGGFGDDMLDLYEVPLSSRCPFKRVRTTHVTSYPYMITYDSANFAAASGVYVSPSGELIVYATSYENDGPYVLNPDGTTGDRQTVPFVEYRHRDIVRPDSPTLHPTASIDGPFAVDEGSSVSLTGTGEPPITKAWIQLFEDDGAGASLPGLLDSDEWLVVDYPDRDADHFDEFDMFGPYERFSENAGSWRWFAPVGCTISANDYPVRSDEFPGPDTVLLGGTGEVEEETDLDDIGYDDDVAGVTFFHVDEQGSRVHDCEGYYNKPIGLAWDLDGDGSFEGNGTSVTFSAASLDGPMTATVGARAQHPTDPTPLGVGVPVSVPVEVRNVAPRVESASVTDSLGNEVGASGAIALAGLPLTLEVTFTDPGVADTQTAAVDWGDGTADTAFDSYSDARFGALGRLQDTHTFGTPGTYDIVTTITDDDGGATPVTVTIEVLSPADAIEAVADQLTALINSATDPDVAAALRAARDQLIGNHGGTPPTNGALDKLDADDPVGAITKIRAAMSYLESAESLGAGDLSPLKDLLGLVAEAIATGAYHEAQAAVAPPSPGEARALASIGDLIALGHQQLSAGQYLGACDSFRQAAAKALKLSG